MNRLVRTLSFGILAVAFFNLAPSSIYASTAEENSTVGTDPEPNPDPTPCPSPTPPPCPPVKQAHFIMECNFQDKEDDECHGHEKCRKCRVFSEFEKMVTLTGGEVVDNSVYPFHPTFEIECNGRWVQKGFGRRFTEVLGTRIQAEVGPYPALVLPRGALNAFPHSSDAKLEEGFETLKGSCFIYTRQ